MTNCWLTNHQQTNKRETVMCLLWPVAVDIVVVLLAVNCCLTVIELFFDCLINIVDCQTLLLAVVK